MPKNDQKVFLPMLARGERYIQNEQTPGFGGGPKDYFRTLSEAQENIMPQLESINENINKMKDTHRVEEVVFSIDLMPDFLAKSYFPAEIIIKSNLTFIGSKPITIPISQRRKEKRANKNLIVESSRKIFVSGKDDSISILTDFLKQPPTKKIEQDFRKLETFAIQGTSEKIINIPKDFDGMAEIVLHYLPEYLKKNEIYKFVKLCKKHNLKCDRDRIRSYTNGPIFCPVSGKSDSLHKIAEYNPLRVVRQMPKLQPLTEIRNAGIDTTFLISKDQPPPLMVGMFDGGVDIKHPALSICTQEESLTSEPPDKQFVSHGTAVASALAYGPLSSTQEKSLSPRVGIHSFRIFPIPPAKNDSDLNYVIDQIESIVPQSDLKIYNLSIGPNQPIEDDDIDHFTYALDNLALKHNVVFFIAAGNNGDLQSPYCRIQPASDMVNGVGVGALTNHINEDGTWTKKRAAYSCKGPGRSGAVRKPDLSAFGGCQEHPFLVLSNSSYSSLNGTYGTSFACPLVAGAAGELSHSQTGILNSLSVRTMMIHTTRELDDLQTCVGNGEALGDVTEILNCQKHRVTIVYQDEIKYGQYNRLPILIPDELPKKSIVKINWTIVYLPSINPNAPDEYTVEQLGVAFRPHDQKFLFSPPKKGIHTKTYTYDIATDEEGIVKLISNGYKQGGLPVSKNTKPKYKTEQDLRIEGKWQDTVILGKGNTRSYNLKNPSLTLNFENRYGISNISKQDSLKYSCIITIETKNTFDLYNKIRQQYRELLPLRIKERLRV